MFGIPPVNEIQPAENPSLATRVFMLSCSSLIPLGVTLSFLSFGVGHEWSDDFALYIAQAQSIVHGSVARLKVHQAMNQTLSSVKLKPGFYPWRFTLLLSPSPFSRTLKTISQGKSVLTLRTIVQFLSLIP